MLAAAVLWGLLGPVARVALAEGVAPVELAFWRATLAAASFGAHALLVRAPLPRRADLPRLLLFGLFGVGFLFLAYFSAVERGGAALATVLLYTAPALVTLVVWIRGSGPLPGRAWGAVALTLVGVAGASNLGLRPVTGGAAALGWGLASGAAFAAYTLLARPLARRYGAAATFGPGMAVGALGLLPLVPFQPDKSAVAWAALVFAGLVPGYLAALCYAEGLRRLDASRAAVLATAEPLVAVVLAVLLWGERVTAFMAAGALCIVAAVVLISLPDRGTRRAPPAQDSASA